MTITVPGVVVSDRAILAVIRDAEADPKLRYDALDDATIAGTTITLALAAPYLIRDWIRAVLALYPHVQPGLAELAAGLPTEETP